jgi:hypothetical protein
MKSISIHGIDGPLWSVLNDRAKIEGKSLNQTIKGLLEQALGLKREGSGSHRQEFEEFCGVWTTLDLEEFNRAVADSATVEQVDWV